MSSAVQIQIEPTLSDAQARQVFDVLVRQGKSAANEVAKAFGVSSKLELIAEVKDNNVRTFLKENVKAVDDLEKAFRKSNKAQDGSLTSLRQQLNSAKQLRDSISKISVSTDAYGKSVLKANEAWTRQNQQVQLLTKQLQIASGSSFFDRIKTSFDSGAIGSFGRSISGVVNTFQSISIVLQQINGAVNLFVNSVKNIQAIELTFQSIGAGVSGASFALDEASRIALDLGVDLKATRNGFQQLTPVILQSGGSLEDVSKVVQSLSSRFAVFGKSADEARRITNAIIQAFGKGALRSEELNQQISEADPAFRVDLAKALRVSTAELNRMIEAGEITSDVLIKTIPLLDKSSFVLGKYGKSAAEAAANIGPLGTTVQGVQSKIASINQLSLERTGQLFLPLLKSIIGVQAVFTDLVDKITKSTAFKVLADIVNALGDSFLSIIKVIAKLLEVILTLLEPLAALAKVLTENEALMKILATVVITAVIVKLALMTKAAIAASVALSKLALSSLIGQQGTALLGTQIAKAAASTPALSKLGGAFKGLGGSIASSVKFMASGQSALGALKTTAGPVGATLKTAFTNPIASAKTLGTAIKQSAATTAAWGNAAIKVATGTNTTSTAFKTLNAQTIRYTGETIKASTSTASFANRTQAAVGALTNTTAGASKLTTALGGIVKAAPRAGLWTVVFAQAESAITSWFNSVKPAEEVAKRLGDLALDSKKSFDEFAESIGVVSPEVKELSTRITGFQQGTENIAQFVLDAATGFGKLGINIKLTSLEAASWSNETVILGQGTAKLTQEFAKQLEVLNRLRDSYDGSAEKKAQLQQGTQLLFDQQKKELESLEALAKERESEVPRTAQAAEAKKQYLSVLRNEILTRKLNIQAIVQNAAAMGLDISKMDEETKKKLALIEALKGELEARQKVLEEAKKEEGAIRDDKLKVIEKENKATQDYYDNEIKKINQTKSATDRRWAAEDAARGRARQLADRTYDAELRRLDQVKAAVEKAYQRPIDALKGLSPAESQLAELDRAELQKQAAQAETQRERLQAQAQLERLKRDEQIAALEKRKAEELAKIEAEKEAKQKQIDEERRRREDEDFKREEERRKKREEFEDRLMKLQEDAAKAQDEADKRKQTAQDEYEQGISEAQSAVLETTGKIKTAQEEVNARYDLLIGKAQRWSGLLDDILAKQKLAAGGPGSGSGTSTGTGTTGGRQTNQRGGGSPRFAGGSVTGGGAYTVNELGPEAFLSKFGKLSMINAPAYGQWRAPGAGTVIPAHITAGLNIPAGGTSVNSGAAATVTRSSGNPMGSIASLLRGAIGAPQGRVTNNVTIQSQNPTKSASDILVEMTKIKRNRYR